MRSLRIHQAGLIWVRIVLPIPSSRICVDFAVGEGLRRQLVQSLPRNTPFGQVSKTRPKTLIRPDTWLWNKYNGVTGYGRSTYGILPDGFVQYLYLPAGVALFTMVSPIRLYMIPCTLKEPSIAKNPIELNHWHELTSILYFQVLDFKHCQANF